MSGRLVSLSDGGMAPAVAVLKATDVGQWSYAAAASGIVNSIAAVTIAPAVVGMRSLVTSLQLSSEALGVATEVAIRNGAGGPVLWRIKIGTAGLAGGMSIIFSDPIKGSVNTLLEFVTLTASLTGGVYMNAQGTAVA